jgi:hypothetical protein
LAKRKAYKLLYLEAKAIADILPVAKARIRQLELILARFGQDYVPQLEAGVSDFDAHIYRAIEMFMKSNARFVDSDSECISMAWKGKPIMKKTDLGQKP